MLNFEDVTKPSFNYFTGQYRENKYLSCKLDLGPFKVDVQLYDSGTVNFEIKNAYYYADYKTDWLSIMKLGMQACPNDVMHDTDDSSFIVWHDGTPPPENEFLLVEIDSRIYLAKKDCERYLVPELKRGFDRWEFDRWAALPNELGAKLRA